MNLQAEILRKHLATFARWSFGILLPGERFIEGWHIDVICEHLVAVQKRQITKLLINLPPRHLKSTICSVVWPVWLWLQNPSEQILSGSYASGLAERDSVASRRIIESPEFCALYGDLRLREDQNQRARYENRYGGYRIAVGIKGITTGDGGSVRILDDALKADEASSDLSRNSALETIRQSWASRVSGSNPVQVVVGQRLHENDVSGYYLKECEGWTHLCLPGLCEADRRCTTRLSPTKTFTDPRDDGEPLWPEMYPEKKLREMAPSEYVWNGQIRQAPSTKGGNIVRDVWLQRWSVLPAADDKHPEKPHGFSFVFSSWDCKFKKTTSGAFVVGQLWAVRWPHFYLVDQKRGRWSFIETCDEIRRAYAEWTALGFDCHSHLIEEAASGSAIVEVMELEIPGVLRQLVEGGDKINRLISQTPVIASGCVFIPDPSLHPWVKEFLAEVLTFPASAEKDQVDAMSQALAFGRKAFASLVYTGDDAPEKDTDRALNPAAVGDEDDDSERLFQ